MDRRFATLLAALAAALLLVPGLAGCTPKMVRVETGTRVVCTYGEVVSDTVKTIEVPADKASSYGVVTKTITCDRHQKLEALYEAAQAALQKGDTSAARASLTRLVAIDPTFRSASSQLSAIKSGSKPKPDTSSPPSTPSTATAGSPGLPATPASDLNVWVPDAITGYSARPIIADVYTVSREYTAKPGTSGGYLVIVAEQFKDAKSATASIKYSIARQYPEDVANVTVEGRSIRFGTEGRQFATAAWVEGSVLVVVEESSDSGAPAALKAHILGIVAEVVK